MSGGSAQVLEIEPKNELIFVGPFTDVITSHIKMRNPLDKPVGFKIKTTVPKCYCVKPSNGYIEPHQMIDVAVMLQPFSYNAAEKFNHKFMIQSIVVPDGPRPSMEVLWKDAPRSKLMDSRLFCLLRMPDELLVEPSRDLVFEGPFVKPVTSIIKLTNPSSQYICFKISASSPEYFSATPSTSVLPPGANSELSVVFRPHDFDFMAKSRERILIQSVVGSEGLDPKKDQTEGKVTDYYLKCIFKNTGIEDKIESSKHEHTSSKPVHDTGMTKADIEALMAEVSALRRENAALKESDLHLRRTAVSATCRMPTESGGSGRHHPINTGALSNIPPILYLILALLIGLFLGRFVL
uniref:MSP domain-containing protein n=1 Tax=Trichobilharzia regenti TaxID=157069 RepID=A0AA85IWL8_TRIRE|nr:unnamed protein product [Trichobilharzia regenti]